MKPAAWFVVLGLAACCGSQRTESKEKHEMMTTNATADERLIANLRAAVEARIAPEQYATFVGEKPIVDTTAGAPMAMLRRVDFQPDPDHPADTVKLDGATAVIYWSRPIPSHDPRVVGAVVHDDGTTQVFFAVIPPP